jgi:hypothetical protein
VEFMSKLEVQTMSEFANVDKYPFTIRPLTVEDGGGYLIEYPDLPAAIRTVKRPKRLY